MKFYGNSWKTAGFR